MDARVKIKLRDAHRAAGAIAVFIDEVDLTGYSSNDLIRSAVERKLEIVGEALNQARLLDPDLENQIPGMRNLVGIRNRIIHGYDSVDDIIIWDVIRFRLPEVAQTLELLLS